MIRGVPVAVNNKPSMIFMREWSIAMAAKKLADPTIQSVLLPYWLDIIDKDGRPTDQFIQLAKLFTPPLVKGEVFADPKGMPTGYALSWWDMAT